MIDLHCHLLPGLDDGPAGMDEALEMARAAVAAGTGTMVATPHIDHRWGVQVGELSRRADLLRDALRAQDIDLLVQTGGEITLARLADLSADELDAVRLGDGPYLLIESPLSSDGGDFEVLLMRVHDRGEQILLAHPERCPLFQREPERLVRCVEAGLLCSITAGAVRGEFGEPVRQFAVEMLRAGLVHDIASDSHDARHRSPQLGDALAYAEPEVPGIQGQSDWLLREAPAAILAGAPLPPRPS